MIDPLDKAARELADKLFEAYAETATPYVIPIIKSALQAYDSRAINQVKALVEALKEIDDHNIYLLEEYGYERGWYDTDSTMDKNMKQAIASAEAWLKEVEK